MLWSANSCHDQASGQISKAARSKMFRCRPSAAYLSAPYGLPAVCASAARIGNATGSPQRAPWHLDDRLWFVEKEREPWPSDDKHSKMSDANRDQEPETVCLKLLFFPRRPRDLWESAARWLQLRANGQGEDLSLSKIDMIWHEENHVIPKNASV